MMPELNKIYQGDCLDIMRGWPDGCVQCCVTSPPYWGLRDYGVDGQFGLEKTPQEYVEKMVAVFRDVRRVLRDDGTLFLNLGDSYASGGSGECSAKSTLNGGAGVGDGEKLRLMKQTPRHIPDGLKHKDIVGIPWMVAFALRSDGWYLRQDIIWHKPNPMPESVTDRCTKAHEYIFLLAKSEKYYYDHEAIKEDADPRYESRYDYGFNEGEKEKQGCGRPDVASNTPGMKAFTGLRNKRSVLDRNDQVLCGGPLRHIPGGLDYSLHPCREPGRRDRTRSFRGGLHYCVSVSKV